MAESTATAETLAGRILGAMDGPEIARGADEAMRRCKDLGFESDWDAVPEKMTAFHRVILAAAAVLPPGGSVETGVFRGGTSGPLILADPPESFHIGIDPFGFPSQSYADLADAYGQWQEARRTMAKLSAVGAQQNVTYCHYTMAASRFIQADLLEPIVDVRTVHLDGDHGEDAVVEELAYFRRKLARPVLFVLDDHDDTYPGVEAGMRRAGAGMARVFHRHYAYPGFPTPLGFSAWVHAP
ncbi:MAG: hypothetical protein L6R19_16890 [Alphaproteobacteria bacterium]|nr:hypothetical protein [Alphaproteobacteria bacterium]